jgi:hypothetical protein
LIAHADVPFHGVKNSRYRNEDVPCHAARILVRKSRAKLSSVATTCSISFNAKTASDPARRAAERLALRPAPMNDSAGRQARNKIMYS